MAFHLGELASYLAVCVLLASTVHAQVALYECPTSTCKPPSCLCPSVDPPGGLDRNSTPQFVLLNFAGSITDSSWPIINGILNGKKHPNGCPVKATIFNSLDYNQYWYTQRLHAMGHEIAVFTVTREADRNTGLPAWRNQINGGRQVLSSLSKIPMNQIVGFRAPLLSYNDPMFQVLQEGNFLWDSSVFESVGGLSQSVRDFIFPYTLNYGVAQECYTGDCPQRSLPGLWEIPVYVLSKDDGSPVNENSALEITGSQEEVFNVLKRNLQYRLDGNHAPFTVNINDFWFQRPSHIAALKSFIDYGLSKGVYFITMTELIQWMKDPTENYKLTCPTPPTGQNQQEVCDGWDNNLDGVVDEFLFKKCTVQGQSFIVCDKCPSQLPTLDNWAQFPAYNGNGPSASASPQPSPAATASPSTGPVASNAPQETEEPSASTAPTAQPSASYAPVGTDTSAASGLSGFNTMLAAVVGGALFAAFHH